jgi:hypothetical protein
MSWSENIKERLREGAENIKSQERHRRFRRVVDASVEEVILKNTMFRISEFADFLCKNKTSLNTYGAIDADFELLNKVDPSSEINIADLKYDSYSNTGVVSVGIMMSTKENSISTVVLISTLIINNKIFQELCRFQGYDMEKIRFVDEGFICLVKDLNEGEPGLHDNDDSSVFISNGGKWMSYTSKIDSEDIKKNYVYIGDVGDKAVLVNIIRKNKNFPRGRGRDKELSKNLSPELNFGKVI